MSFSLFQEIKVKGDSLNLRKMFNLDTSSAILYKQQNYWRKTK
jgi:hypothetical protein